MKFTTELKDLQGTLVAPQSISVVGGDEDS
jgi:hypothetical protein